MRCWLETFKINLIRQIDLSWRAEFRQDLAIFSVMFLALLFAMAGCAQQTIKPPTSSAVEGGFHNIEGNVSTAQSQNADIARENAKARAKLERIHDKEIIAIRYREYRAKHPRPTPTP